MQRVQQGENRGKRRILKVYTIVEKPGERGIWLEIGVAGVNKDGSISTKLDALPVNGMLHMREYEPRKPEATVKNNETPYQSWRQRGTER